VTIRIWRLPGERRVDPGAGIMSSPMIARTGTPNDYADRKSPAHIGMVRYLGDDTSSPLMWDIGTRSKRPSTMIMNYWRRYRTYRHPSRHLVIHATPAHPLSTGWADEHPDIDNRSTTTLIMHPTVRHPIARHMPIHELDAQEDNTGIYAQNVSRLDSATKSDPGRATGNT